jgi:hypothetical protein
MTKTCKYGINSANITKRNPAGTCLKKPCKNGSQPPCKKLDEKSKEKSKRKTRVVKITLAKVLKYLANPNNAPKSVPQEWLGDINGNLPHQKLNTEEKEQLHMAAYRFRLFERSWKDKQRAIDNGFIPANHKTNDYDNYLKAFKKK